MKKVKLKKLTFPKTAPVQIVQVGAGGTGSYASPKIHKKAFALKALNDREVSITTIDKDHVTPGNIGRQNFCPDDADEEKTKEERNKARIMATRYGSVYGIESSYYSKFLIDTKESFLVSLTEEQRLSLTEKEVDEMTMDYESFIQILTPKTKKHMVILIGCVDNKRARQIMHKAFMDKRLTNIIYIDAGNGEYTGQVVCGVKKSGKIRYQPVGSIFKDTISDDEVWVPELSCGQVVISAPQSMEANDMAATAINCFLNDILLIGELETRYITFSATSINMRPIKEVA